jgi:hypothetical protein
MAWTECLEMAQLSYGAVGEATEDYAHKRPELHSESAPTVIILYLNQFCGFDTRAPQWRKE